LSQAIDAAKKAKGTSNDLDMDAGDMKRWFATFKGYRARRTRGPATPAGHARQMDMAVKSGLRLLHAARANLYRRQGRITADAGHGR